MPGRRTSTLALVAAVTAISFAAIFFRLAAPTHPVIAAAVRLTIAAVLMSPVIIRARRRGRFPIRVMKMSLFAGASYALHFGAWVTSLTLTSVAASVTLVTATPIILAIVSWRSARDAATKRMWRSFAVAIVGLAILGGNDLLHGGEDALMGDGLALVGCAAMAVYMLIVRSLGPDLDAWAFSGAACATGAVMLWGTAAAMGVPLHVPTAQAWIFLALAALIPQLVGHGLITWSLRNLTPTKVGLATVAEPIGSTVLAIFILNEPPPALIIAGGIITLGAVALALSSQSPRAEEAQGESR